jgi:hypothetical protein
MTVKNDLLWIGSLGKEWTNDKGVSSSVTNTMTLSITTILLYSV